MTRSTMLLARLTTGLCGITVGAYCAFTAFRNGEALGHGIDGIAFGAAFAAVVAGSWFLLPIAAQAKADGNSGRSWSIRLGWALCLAFVLVNAIGFTANHRTTVVGDKATAITAYDRALVSLTAARADLAVMRANKRFEATFGCTDATAEKSLGFCAEVQAKQADVAKAEATLAKGRPVTTDAQAETIAWVMQMDAATVSRALPVFMAVVLDIAASLFMFAAMPAQQAVDERPIIELVAVEAAPVPVEAAPALTVIEKPKRVAKAKPKAIAHQPAIMAKMDGRKTRGMRMKAANAND